LLNNNAARHRNRYSWFKALAEPVMEIAYCFDWPSKVYDRVNRNPQVNIISQSIRLTDKYLEKQIRTVFVSDLHIGPTTSEHLLNVVFCKIAECKPDILLLGGDYVFLRATEKRMRLLSQLIRSVNCTRIYAVIGNHDIWADEAMISDALQSAGVTLLVNTKTMIEYNNVRIEIVGLDDPYAGTCSGTISTDDRADVRVVMCHSPEGLRYLDKMQFDLFLCGHTHGGQVASPWGPILVPYGELCRKFSSGFNHHKEGLIFVSRGIGTVEFPLRFFAPPDFLVLDFHGEMGEL
jgi:predicted MPP superfamily phosphohydrolase